MRAKYNDFVKKGMYGDHKGLSCFSPVINIMRHPQWGRNQVSILLVLVGYLPFVDRKPLNGYIIYFDK